MPVIKLENHKQWTHIGLDNSLKFGKPIDIQFVTYSNGLPCVEVNAYIKQLILNGKKSSTIRTYVYNIYHLVRFVEEQPLLSSFEQLNNSLFKLFIHNLQREIKTNGEKLRKTNTVITIGAQCLDFLCFVKSFHDLDNFIDTDKSSSIIITEKEYKFKPEGYKNYKYGTTKKHTSFPDPDERKKRHPVGEEDALAVWQYIKTQKGKDKRRRDMAFYTSMEQLGARVKELSLMTLTDFENAKQTGLMKLVTLKRKGTEEYTRMVPVPSIFITSISDYLKVRKKVTKSKKVNHDYLFISLTTGKQLSAGTWTTYIKEWQNKLGIKTPISPHRWRHAFVTEKLKELILADDELNSKDDFRAKLLHTNTFKQQLQQWTGHSTLNSLDIYIDLIFAELNGYAKVYSAVSLSNAVKLVERQLEYFKEQLNKGEISNTDLRKGLDELINSFSKDINSSTEHR
ncbi:tyrosine-type recombinase/integrase [Vibrio sp. 10N.261.51.A3]|uniref:tyrosine-type recombinase/integrase n=1 Tax=Vibrio TaxID=662 RepID=UPI000C82E969|nr:MULTISPECIES: tyrosine-type recombinase/integrase [Vibrio]PMF54655.1 integrase [Vibrio cyclitrophicus]TKF90066.1 site-specific integrase [Vibrio sp. F13]